MKRIFCAALALLLLAGCAGEESPSSSTPDTAVTVTDMTGRAVTLDAPATRVVALTAADCEILFAVGAGDTLVGRGTYCNWPEEAQDAPAVESGAGTNLEEIIALKPQVVLMNTMAQTVDQVEALEKAGIRVVTSAAEDIDGVYTSIALIGAVTGHDTEAADLVADMKASFSDVAARAVGDGEKTIYFEVSPLEYGLWTAGSGTFMDELATMLGLKNVFADVDGWAEISQEQVIARDPDYIVTLAMSYGDGPTPVEEILGRAGWEDIAAVQSGAVFNADSDQISRPGPRLVEAAEALCDFVYGPDTSAEAA
ncbi:MAG TPA: ABC transporter substrate-binding protein [Oscillospiraceae bacterium]|nr:ABC transporter substrate-binding protein [Oscillospiraceae bacterium]